MVRRPRRTHLRPTQLGLLLTRPPTCPLCWGLAGRHFLNIQEMMMGLQERYGAIADVELRYLEHTTLLEQVGGWVGGGRQG